MSAEYDLHTKGAQHAFAPEVDTDKQDAQRWRKARTLPRSWWRDAFNEIQKGGRSLEEQIDAYRERNLP